MSRRTDGHEYGGPDRGRCVEGGVPHRGDGLLPDRVGQVQRRASQQRGRSGGLIKTVLAMKARQIPPSLHFEREIQRLISPTVHLSSTRPDAWRAAQSAALRGQLFRNRGHQCAHVLEEAPVLEPSSEGRADKLLLVSQERRGSDRGENALGQVPDGTPDINLSDTAYTLQAGGRPSNGEPRSLRGRRRKRPPSWHRPSLTG